MKLVNIPANKFIMGSREKESGRQEDDNQVDVTISCPFYLGVTEVTQGQWKSVMSSAPWKGKDLVKEGADYPATFVSWDDAVSFCKKLSKREGKTYRLPTEAEWEYACRGGSTTAYSFGSSKYQLIDHAWIDANTWNIGERYAHEVGQKRSNSFGLYDMHGNVWEWCSDLYGSSLPGGLDPQGATSGAHRVYRGGSWFNDAVTGRSAHRNWYRPDTRYSFLGFRVSLQSVR